MNIKEINISLWGYFHAWATLFNLRGDMCSGPGINTADHDLSVLEITAYWVYDRYTFRR